MLFSLTSLEEGNLRAQTSSTPLNNFLSLSTYGVEVE